MHVQQKFQIKMLNLLFRNLGRIRFKTNKISLSNPNCLVGSVSFWESDFDGLNLCDAFRDLVPFVQFKKREIHPRKSVTFSKVAVWSHGCFSRFLNCTNCTKLRNLLHMCSVILRSRDVLRTQSNMIIIIFFCENI